MKHAMKVVERIFEHRIRQQTEIDDMQFGFMKGKGTIDAIFMARQTKENFREGKKLYFGFVDLAKNFDRVPRKVISWAMRKLVVEEWLVSRVARSPVVYGEIPYFRPLLPPPGGKPPGRTNLPYSVSQIVESIRRHCDT